MHGKLKEVMERVAALPEADQERLAALIEAELNDEALWDEKFEAYKPELRALAADARAEYRAGATEPLDPETL